MGRDWATLVPDWATLVPGARMGRDWIWILGADVVREAVCLGFAGESRERWGIPQNLAGLARRNVRAR